MVMSTGTGAGSSSLATSYTTVLSAITFSAVSSSGRASRVTSNATISGLPLVRGQLGPFTPLRGAGPYCPVRRARPVPGAMAFAHRVGAV